MTFKVKKHGPLIWPTLGVRYWAQVKISKFARNFGKKRIPPLLPRSVNRLRKSKNATKLLAGALRSRPHSVTTNPPKRSSLIFIKLLKKAAAREERQEPPLLEHHRNNELLSVHY